MVSIGEKSLQLCNQWRIDSAGMDEKASLRDLFSSVFPELLRDVNNLFKPPASPNFPLKVCMCELVVHPMSAFRRGLRRPKV